MKRLKIFFFIGLMIISLMVKASKESQKGFFSGSIVEINIESQLIRIYTKFINQKYLNQKDSFDLWASHNPSNKCKGILLLKSKNLLLIRLKLFKKCLLNLPLSNGARLTFYSQDLVNNIKMGQEVVKILNKKYYIYKSRISRNKKEIDAFNTRMNIINKRYDILRKKLENERSEMLRENEQNRNNAQIQLMQDQKKIVEINKKLSLYHIADDNFEQDKWSLNPQLYFKK